MLPQWHPAARHPRAIEDGLRQRQLLAVAATTTLAEGVDLPFRFTILVDWLAGGKKQRPMPTLLFRNIAGRCGRAGMLTEGDTIVVDNPLGDPTYSFDPNHRLIQDEIFLADAPAEVTSAMDQASPGTEEQQAMLGALASQFIAAIPENPRVENLARKFGAGLFRRTARRTPAASGPRCVTSKRPCWTPPKGLWQRPRVHSSSTPFGEAAVRTASPPQAVGGSSGCSRTRMSRKRCRGWRPHCSGD